MIMTYEFANLDDLVIKAIRPPQLLSMPLGERASKDEQLLLDISTECRRICTAFHEYYYTTGHMDLVSRYFAQQLKYAMGLSDKIHAYLLDQAVRDESDLQSFYHQVSTSIGSIVEYILHHFEEHFNFETEMPLSANNRARAELGELVENLYQHFRKFPELSDLLDVIVLPIRPFLDRPDGTINYRLYHYYQFFIYVLLQLGNKDAETANMEIHVVCSYLNFNSAQYITFSIDRLKVKMKDDPMEAQLGKLRWYIKSIKQAEKTHGLYIDTAFTSSPVARLHAIGKLSPEPGAASASEQLRAWIKLEVEYLEYVHNLNQNGAPNKAPFKIATGLTVWKLAIFTEAFVKNKVFVPTSEMSYNRTLKGVASIVYTPGADVLSFESLRTKASTLRNLKNQKNVAVKVTQSLEECADHFLDCYNTCRQWIKDAKPS